MEEINDLDKFKFFLMDTNALLDCPEFIEQLGDNEGLVITSDVFRELEQLELQRRSHELGYQVRKAKRMLDDNFDDIMVFDSELSNIDKYMPEGYSETYVDNRILASALALSKSIEDTDTLTVVTNDLLLSFKLRACGIDTCKTDNQELRYEGVQTFYYHSSNEEHNEIVADIYTEDTENLLGLVDGQYLELVDVENNNKIVGIMKYENGMYVRVSWLDVMHSTYGPLKPINTRQKFAFDLMQDESRPVKLITGGMGSGKDKIMLTHALEKADLEDKKIIWVRNIVEVKDSGKIGALPGTELEKLEPWFRLVGDIVGDEYIMEDLINRGTLQIENLGYIRGRQFDNAIIYATEAQNMTIEHIALLLGRAGNNTEVYLNGDWAQSDTGKLSGIDALSKIAGNELFGKVELNEIERSAVARLAELL